MRLARASVGVLLRLLITLLALSKVACLQQKGQQRPVLQMVEDFVQLSANQSEVRLGVQLVGAASGPVRAWVKLAAPGNGSEAAWVEAEEPDAWLSPSELLWQPNESGVHYVQLRSALELLEDLPEGEQLYVRIEAATPNADVQPLRDATLLSLASRGSQPVFGYVPNQVAYPPPANSSQVATIPVRLVGGRLAEPATVRYKVSLLTSAPLQFLPSRSLSGLLVFSPGKAELNISLPVVWSRVPADAEYRLGVQLEGLWGTRVQNQSESTVGLHLFGVPNGTCPPGTSTTLSGSAANSSALSQPLNSTALGGYELARVPGVEAVFFLSKGSGLNLSSSLSPSTLAYGASVEWDVENVTMCVKDTEDIVSLKVVGENKTSTRRIYTDVDDICGCSPLNATEDDSEGGSSGEEGAAGPGDECNYKAWQLQLDWVGSNQFNTTVTKMLASNSSSNSSSNSKSSKAPTTTTKQYSLSIVRKANPAHAQLASLTLRSSDGSSVLLCGTAESQQQEAAAVEAEQGGADSNGSNSDVLKALEVQVSQAAQPSNSSVGASSISRGSSSRNSSSSSSNSSNLAPPLAHQLDLLLGPKRGVAPLKPTTLACDPDVTMSVNVSFATTLITLSPTLMFPGIKGIRVEVNGQVLSRGGDITADQEADTTAQPPNSRPSMSFLPAAFLIGLQPNIPFNIEVVVVAEDGVTSSRYSIAVTRQPNLTPPPAQYGGLNLSGIVSNSSWVGASDVVAYASPVSPAEQWRKGWPRSPAQQPQCSACSAGWASTSINASQCTMCPPGTYAAEARSSKCLPCQPGTYAYSWGSSHCKHCIAGTYSPGSRSDLCQMCPANWTSMEDGQAECTVPLTPATDTQQRYAVVVTFSVYLTGLDPEGVLLKSGVNAPVEQIVGSLIQSDTAYRFNISLQDVTVNTYSHSISRRTLQANVTAALGVDLPAGATEEDISAALEVQKLSADKPIEMLSQDPDTFFGRTTRTLDVEVESSHTAAVAFSRPQDSPAHFNPLFLLIPGAGGIVLGVMLIYQSCRRSPRCRAWWAQQWRRVRESSSSAQGAAVWQLPTSAARQLGRSAARYVRYRS